MLLVLKSLPRPDQPAPPDSTQCSKFEGLEKAKTSPLQPSDNTTRRWPPSNQLPKLTAYQEITSCRLVVTDCHRDSDKDQGK